MQVVGQFGARCHRFGRRAPLDEPVQHQAGSDNGGHMGGDRSVLLDNAIDEPAPHPLVPGSVRPGGLFDDAITSGRPSMGRRSDAPISLWPGTAPTVTIRRGSTTFCTIRSSQ